MQRAILKFKDGGELNVVADYIVLNNAFVEVWNGDKLIARSREKTLNAYYLIDINTEVKKENVKVKRIKKS